MEPLSKELLDLEHQLRLFVPQTPQTSREQMLYQAGWDAALAQQASSVLPAAPTTLPKNSPRSATNYYWAAACAALAVLSTALAWQVVLQPQSGPATMITTCPPTPRESNPSASPKLANIEITVANAEPGRWANSTSGLVNYLELRERVTRGGLNMWPVSTPAPGDPGDSAQVSDRDWQEELFRETL